MHLHWVPYRHNNLLAGAVIIEAASQDHAQIRADLQWDDPLLQFLEAHTLSNRQASLVPEHAKSRLLSLSETHCLFVRFEQAQQRHGKNDGSL